MDFGYDIGNEKIVAHVREAFEVKSSPDWDNDLYPFMKQYGNLYPIMSKRLFSLSDPKIIEAHAELLILAFSRPIDDPNHMPVTRDLSLNKRNTILAWLAQHTNKPTPKLAASNVKSDEKLKSQKRPRDLKRPMASLATLANMRKSFDGSGEGKVAAMRSIIDREIEMLQKDVENENT